MIVTTINVCKDSVLIFQTSIVSDRRVLDSGKWAYGFNPQWPRNCCLELGQRLKSWTYIGHTGLWGVEHYCRRRRHRGIAKNVCSDKIGIFFFLALFDALDVWSGATMHRAVIYRKFGQRVLKFNCFWSSCSRMLSPCLYKNVSRNFQWKTSRSALEVSTRKPQVDVVLLLDICYCEALSISNRCMLGFCNAYGFTCHPYLSFIPPARNIRML